MTEVPGGDWTLANWTKLWAGVLGAALATHGAQAVHGAAQAVYGAAHAGPVHGAAQAVHGAAHAAGVRPGITFARNENLQ